MWDGHSANAGGGRVIRRHLLTPVTVLPLLLYVTVVVLWVRSYWGWDCAVWKDERIQPRSSLLAAWSGNGSFWLFHEGYDSGFRQRFPPAHEWAAGRFQNPPFWIIFDPTDGQVEPHHWLMWSHQGSCADGYQMLICPYWIAVLCTPLPPMGWVALSMARNARRRKRNLCPTCSYSLNANRSGVCPECGRAVAGKSAAA